MPVFRPTPSEVHIDRPLSNFSQRYMQQARMFVAGRAFPSLPVNRRTDQYYVFNRDDWYRNQMQRRAPGTETPGSGFKLSTENYRADVWGLHTFLTDQGMANADDGLQLAFNDDESATAYLTQQAMINREVQMVNNLFVATAWTTYTAPNVNWATGTDDPVVQIRDATRAVEENTGYTPNKMLVGRQAMDTLLDNDSILDRITGGSDSENPAQVTMRNLAALFEIDQIFVTRGVQNTSVEGAATQTTAYIGGDNVLLYYAPDSVGRFEPTAGVRFDWIDYINRDMDMSQASPEEITEMSIQRIRNEDKAGEKIEIEMAFDYRQTGAELGYFFAGVSS